MRCLGHKGCVTVEDSCSQITQEVLVMSQEAQPAVAISPWNQEWRIHCF